MVLTPFVVCVGFVFYGLLAAQVLAADQDGMRTVGQAYKKGLSQFLPFMWHSGMWGDLVLPIWFMAVIAMYSQDWDVVEFSISLAFGMVASYLLHESFYRKAKIPEAHAHDGKLTAAGWLHCVYMGLGFGLTVQFYVLTKHVAPWFIWLSSITFGLHLTLAFHILPALWCQLKGESWYPPRPWREKGFWILVPAIWAMLTTASILKIIFG